MAGKKVKLSSHDIGVMAQNNIHSLIDASRKGLFREFTGRNYGIDALVEVFEDGAITGKIALIQCKGQEDAITSLATAPSYVSCSDISSSNLEYAMQNTSVVILTYASLTDRDDFYFANLSDVITEEHKRKYNEGQKSFTVRIPIVNNAKTNMDEFWNIIDRHYTRD